MHTAKTSNWFLTLDTSHIRVWSYGNTPIMNVINEIMVFMGHLQATKNKYTRNGQTEYRCNNKMYSEGNNKSFTATANHHYHVTMLPAKAVSNVKYLLHFLYIMYYIF